MNPVLALVSVAGLTLLAAAGVIAGFRRRDPLPVEPVADPLQDRRLALLRSLADLEDARTAGALELEDYERLRSETEGRMARLLRAIDDRRVRELREGAEPASARPAAARVSAGIPTWAVALLLTATVGAVLVAGLLRTTEPPAAAAPSAATGNPFAFFEERVRAHPDDLAARLDLARRYLDDGRIDDALSQYAVALDLDPDDAEAHAHVGLILYLAGRPEEALGSVDRALQTSPEYPEALFIRGLILLRGLDRPAPAIEALEHYLDAAPFGAERSQAQDLIDQARRALAGEQPGG